MASTLRVDQLQTSNGIPLLSSDGSGILSVESRFKLPQYNTENLPTNAEAGEVVFDLDDLIAKFWDGEEWKNIGSPKITSNILGMYYKIWNTNFQNSNTQTYEIVPDSSLTFTTKEQGSSFLLLQDVSWYSSASAGSNGAFYFNGTLIGGVSGGSGDAWMGGMHSGISSSYNHKRVHTHSPNLPKGASVTVAYAQGCWTNTSVRSNYSGYGINSSLVVLEYINQ